MTDTRLVHLNYHAPLGRLGGAKGEALQATAFAKVRARVGHYADDLGLYVVLTTDDNDHGLNKPHPRARLLARDGIDKIWLVPPRRKADRDALTVERLQTKVVRLTIDGHNAVGVQLRLTPAGGRRVVLWVVQCNLGRGESTAQFVANATKVRRGFLGVVLIGFDEIDEADRPEEHEELRVVFPGEDGYDVAGWGTYVPAVLRGAAGVSVVQLVRVKITVACRGMAKVTPDRVITESILALR